MCLVVFRQKHLHARLCTPSGHTCTINRHSMKAPDVTVSLDFQHLEENCGSAFFLIVFKGVCTIFMFNPLFIKALIWPKQFGAALCFGLKRFPVIVSKEHEMSSVFQAVREKHILQRENWLLKSMWKCRPKWLLKQKLQLPRCLGKHVYSSPLITISDTRNRKNNSERNNFKYNTL